MFRGSFANSMFTDNRRSYKVLCILICAIAGTSYNDYNVFILFLKNIFLVFK